MPQEYEISRQERRMDDCKAKINIARARVIRWCHSGNACHCWNKIIQFEGCPQRRSHWYLEAKCGRCHQTVRLYQVRGQKRFTIDPGKF